MLFLSFANLTLFWLTCKKISKNCCITSILCAQSTFTIAPNRYITAKFWPYLCRVNIIMYAHGFNPRNIT